jgi:hypothetical protein
MSDEATNWGHAPGCGLIHSHEGQCGPPAPDETGRKAQRIAFLERKRLVTIEDAKVKLEAEDWHGIRTAGVTYGTSTTSSTG